MNYRLVVCGLLLATTFSCNTNHKKELPIYGERTLDSKGDTIYHQVDQFYFINQDSQVVNRQTFEGKIYVTDFFFTKCPTVCPLMTAQLLRVHNAFIYDPSVLFLSHSIDYRADSVSVLKAYADQRGVKSAKWHFVTGSRNAIYDIAKQGYYMSAREDAKAKGGYLHNEKFILVDKKGRVRGYYTGTEPTAVNQLIEDIHVLLQEDKQ